MLASSLATVVRQPQTNFGDFYIQLPVLLILNRLLLLHTYKYKLREVDN